MEKLLALRKALKAKKPEFMRQDSHKKPSLGRKWRKPKGIHSKMREYRKGHGSRVNKGWKSPAVVRSLDRSGLKPVLVASSTAIASLKAGVHGIIIQSSTGLKSRTQIIEEAMKRNIALLNVKKPKEFLEQVKELLAGRKQARARRKAEREKKEREQEKKAVEKKKEEKKEKVPEVTEEERKEQEKRELDKLLTRPE